MPTIPKLSQTKKKYFKSKAREPKRDILNNAQQKYFNTRKYREFHRVCLMRQPICELSLLSDPPKVVEATHTHHLIKWFDQTTEEMRLRLLYDPDNILCLDEHVHQWIHYSPERLSDKQKEFIKQRKDEVYAKYLAQGIIINYTDDHNPGRFFGDQK